MGYAIVKQNDKFNYDYKEFFLDTEEDLSSIPVEHACVGSIAYIIDSGKIFILNSAKE